MRRVILPEVPDKPVRRLLGGESTEIEIGRLLVVAVVVLWAMAPVIGFLGSLTLLTGLAFLVTLAGFGRPTLAVLGISLICTLDPLTRHYLANAILRWNTFNYLLLMVMAVSAGFVLRLADPHSRILKLFIVLLTAELVFTPALENGIQHVLGIATLFGLLVYFAQARGNEDTWYMAGLVNGTAGAMGGLMHLLLKDSVPYMNANAYALFPETAVFAMCLAFPAAASRPGGQLKLSILATINMLWAFYSGSRGGILIVAVGLAYMIFTMKRAAHRMAFTVAGVATVMITLTVFSGMENRTIHRITKMFDSEQSAASRTNGRSDLARGAVFMFKQHPLGVGTGGFAPTWAALGYLPGLSTFARGKEFQAHSGWIKVLSENGWPGALLMFAYVFSFAWYGLRVGMPALGLLVTTAMTATFISVEFQGKGIWMLAAGATAIMHPREMARCLSADVERFVSRERRLVSSEPSPHLQTDSA